MYVHFSIPTFLLWLLLEHLNQVLLVFNVQVKIYTITQKVIFIYLFFGGGMFDTALAEIPVCFLTFTARFWGIFSCEY